LLGKKLAMITAVTIIAGILIGYFINSLFLAVRDVSIAEIVSDPQSFDGARVRLFGFVVDTSVYMFGPKYVLRDIEEAVEIALNGKAGPQNLDLKPYVSFVFDGRNFTQIRNINVSVIGRVHYIGPVVDVPSFYLDIEKLEPQKLSLEMTVIEFLRTTDVPKGGWDGTIEIKEIYDHKPDGKVIVVEYTTVNGGHPGFFLEAIEHHTSVITFDTRGEVVSAFCVSGSFHDGRIWDLINQRWISSGNG